MMSRKVFALKDADGDIRLPRTTKEAREWFLKGPGAGYPNWAHAEAAGYKVVEVEIREVVPPKPILGQEAICPDGLGRVTHVETGRENWIVVDTYVKNRSCHWARENVELIDPRGGV